MLKNTQNHKKVKSLLIPQAQIEQHNARIVGHKTGGVSGARALPHASVVSAAASSRRVPRDDSGLRPIR